MPDAVEKARCAAQNKRGEPCKASPVRGSPHCFAHNREDPRSAEFFGKGHEGRGGRPRIPRATDVLRQRIEADVDAWLQPLVDLRDHAVLYGTNQKTGEVVVSNVPDIGARAKAVDLAFKWVYALPKSGVDVDITPGTDGGVVVRLAFDPAGSNDNEGDDAS